MRTVSQVRKSIVWIFKVFLNDSFKATQRESGSLFPYFGCAASHSEFDSVGARNIPERLRLTKAVLQSKDIAPVRLG